MQPMGINFMCIALYYSTGQCWSLNFIYDVICDYAYVIVTKIETEKITVSAIGDGGSLQHPLFISVLDNSLRRG